MGEGLAHGRTTARCKYCGAQGELRASTFRDGTSICVDLDACYGRWIEQKPSRARAAAYRSAALRLRGDAASFVG